MDGSKNQFKDCLHQSKSQKGPIFKIQVVLTSKLNLNGDQFSREISKFDYLNNLQIILKEVKNFKICKSIWGICYGNLIKN